MSKDHIQRIIDSMDPREASDAVVGVLRDLLSSLAKADRQDLLVRLIGCEEQDDQAKLVDFWLATCMDEGVDPKNMCQSLVEKIGHSEQLRSVADPEILMLFEDWLEELESEVVSAIRRIGSQRPDRLARELGLSDSGATFLVVKLKRDGKLPV